ncbi:hypothetical protein B0T25DRAFT_569702 [Lasiosphaeria hispida]|uniref:Uncharacterized protein n=1 Tax=Lasiosphaeria hispida TaxID=260671 RepID=A0AAJ0HDU7_9PEZI|nr:hypothetical protein B0T25DRAFT_569702 [Lasiosphaeria hispida]
MGSDQTLFASTEPLKDAPLPPALIFMASPSTMVANAGIAQVKPLLDITPEDFERIGKLIGAANIVAFKTLRPFEHYARANWAVRGLTQVYAMELAWPGITVNAYAPGIVDTAMWELINQGLAEKAGTAKGGHDPEI